MFFELINNLLLFYHNKKNREKEYRKNEKFDKGPSSVFLGENADIGEQEYPVAFGLELSTFNETYLVSK